MKMFNYTKERFCENFNQCTKRQKEIIYLVRYYPIFDKKKIADRLGIAPSTLNTHFSNLYLKFELYPDKDAFLKLFHLIINHLGYVQPRQGERRRIEERLLNPFKEILALENKNLSYLFNFQIADLTSSKTLQKIREGFSQELNEKNYVIKQKGRDCSLEKILDKSIKLTCDNLRKNLHEKDIYWKDLIVIIPKTITSLEQINIEFREKRRGNLGSYISARSLAT